MIPIYLNDQITEDSVSELMDRLSSVEGDNVTIYVTSNGGDWYATQVLIHYIESKFKCVDIVVSGYAISSAWKFLLKLKNIKSVTMLDGSYACDHLPTITTGSQYSAYSNYVLHNEMSKKLYEDDCEDWCNLCKESFKYTEQEVKDLRDGKNVYFSTERAREILENANLHRKL